MIAKRKHASLRPIASMKWCNAAAVASGVWNVLIFYDK